VQGHGAGLDPRDVEHVDHGQDVRARRVDVFERGGATLGRQASLLA
jgi:hypothetical protein